MAVVECIKEKSFLKAGQSFDNSAAYGVFVIPKENHIRMRYLLFNQNSSGGSLDSHLVDFDQHYYSFIEDHKLQDQISNNLRIDRVYLKYQTQRINRLVEIRKQKEEEERKQALLQAEAEADKKLEKLAGKISGHGSKAATERI
jgi:hypothetical protein